MSDPLTHAQLDHISQQLRGGVDSFTASRAQSDFQRLNLQIQAGGVPDAITHAKLLEINQRLRNVPMAPLAHGGTASAGPAAPPEPPLSLRDAPGIVLTLVGWLGWLLLPLEALGAALLTWVYVGSAKGLTLPMADGSVIGGLHWDPFLAILLSLVAGVAWALLFFVPVAGPLVGLAVSAAWGVAAYVGTASLGFGLFAFTASLLARMLMRSTQRTWLRVVEWGVVAAAAILALAPLGPALPLPGFGGWEALRQVHDTQSCDRELRLGAWKDRYAGTPAFFADRKACANARSLARRAQ